jgi:glycerophosphoryl diester phosphodiesterase
MGFLDAHTPIAMAHRGFATDGDENTMAAFQRAVDLGYRYLETDVRVTSDDVPVTFHDSALYRLTERRGRLQDATWSQVRGLRIAGREPIARLEDVLATWPEVFVNIDIKSDSAVGPTISAIERTRSLDRVCIGAFSDARLAAVRGLLGSSVCTSLGPVAATRLVMNSRRGAAEKAFTGQCAQLPSRLGRLVLIDARVVTAAHRNGLQVHAWTVNQPEEMTRLLDLGVDGIITDQAEDLRDALSERGQWPPR